MKKLVLTHGYNAIIDDNQLKNFENENFRIEHIYDKNGQMVEKKLARNKKLGYLHRLIAENIHGKLPKNAVVRFKNNNPLDCRSKNLFITLNGSDKAKEKLFNKGKNKPAITNNKLPAKTNLPIKIPTTVADGVVGVTPRIVFDAILIDPSTKKIYNFGAFSSEIEAMEEYNKEAFKLSKMLKKQFPLNDRKIILKKKKNNQK